MFTPKNIITYLAVGLPDADTLEQALAKHPFQSPGPQELSRDGWTRPASCVDSLVLDSHGTLLIALKHEERVLPAAVVRDALAEKVADIEAEQCRKVYAKEKRQLKEEIVTSLLPKAFLRSRITQALICPEQGLIHVDASSHTRAEVLLNRLREALGSLKIRLPQTAIAPDKVMTGWLQGDALPTGWALEDECTLRDPMTDSGKITAKGQDLLSEEITAHIVGGYMVKRLALEWQQRIRLVLHEDLSLHRLRLSDEYQDALDAEAPEDEQAALEASVWLWGKELNQLTTEMIATFGGDSFALEQEQDGVAA